MSSRSTDAQVGARATDALIAAIDGNAAAREDVRWMKSTERSAPLEALVGDGDRLQQHRAAGRSSSLQLRKKRVEVLVADSLDHLDRDQLVVAAR